MLKFDLNKYYKYFMFVFILVFLATCSENSAVKPTFSIEELYQRAVHESMVINDKDILPLIEISQQSQFCSWDSQGRILLLTHHRYPDSYIPNQDYTLIYGEVWTFTDKEIIQFYKNNKNTPQVGWEMRFKQLIGLPPNRSYTHFSALWVNPEDVIRPGYAWKLSDTMGASNFIETPSQEYQNWFNNNILWSYFESAFPWTRLGYTYDWESGYKKYGLSEFLIKKDAVVHVEFTLDIEEFLRWLDSQKK